MALNNGYSCWIWIAAWKAVSQSALFSYSMVFFCTLYYIMNKCKAVLFDDYYRLIPHTLLSRCGQAIYQIIILLVYIFRKSAKQLSPLTYKSIVFQLYIPSNIQMKNARQIQFFPYPYIYIYYPLKASLPTWFPLATYIIIYLHIHPHVTVLAEHFTRRREARLNIYTRARSSDLPHPRAAG